MYVHVVRTPPGNDSAGAPRANGQTNFATLPHIGVYERPTLGVPMPTALVTAPDSRAAGDLCTKMGMAPPFPSICFHARKPFFPFLQPYGNGSRRILV